MFVASDQTTRLLRPSDSCGSPHHSQVEAEV